MKIVLDEGVPEQIAHYLTGHDVQSTRQLGLKGLVNGKLLNAFEKSHFEVVISSDKKWEFDQNLTCRPFAVLLLSTNHLPTIVPKIGKIAAALQTAEKGKVTTVDVGTFVPKRFRPQAP